MQAQTPEVLFRALIISLVLVGLHPGASATQGRRGPTPPSQASPIVLEIVEKDARPGASGEEHLYFRLYQDGKAEFEVRSRYGSSHQGFRIQRINLSDDDRDELVSLGAGCLRSPMDFDPMQRFEEKVTISKIRIRGEDGDYHQITIHNYAPENEKTRLYFPRAARVLIQAVSHIRQKYVQET